MLREEDLPQSGREAIRTAPVPHGDGLALRMPGHLYQYL